jgi:hypothetical protein
VALAHLLAKDRFPTDDLRNEQLVSRHSCETKPSSSPVRLLWDVDGAFEALDPALEALFRSLVSIIAALKIRAVSVCILSDVPSKPLEIITWICYLALSLAPSHQLLLSNPRACDDVADVLCSQLLDLGAIARLANDRIRRHRSAP